MTDKIVDRTLYGVDVPVFSQDGLVLMLKRMARDEKFPTGWEYVKGGLLEDETYVQAAFREAVEESGQLGYELLVELPGEYKIDARYRHKPDYDFVVKRAVVLIAKTTAVVLDRNEHVAYKWMTPNEAIKNIWVEEGDTILRQATDAFKAMAQHSVR